MGDATEYEDLEVSCGCGFLWSQFEIAFDLEDVRYCVCCGDRLLERFE